MILRGKYQIFGLIALLAMFCSVEALMAQPGGRGQRSLFGQSSGIGLLGQEGVQEELELVEDQVDDIKALQEEQRTAMRDMFTTMRGGGDREQMMEKFGEMRKEFDEKANEVLLPHQVKRLKQLLVQDQTRRSAGATTLPESIIEELGLTEEQIEKMKEKAESVRDKMNEKIAKIRAQAQEEVLSVLDSDQRARYKEMVGDAYQFPQRNARGGAGDRGGRGGGAGARGGGGRGGAGGAGGRGGRRPGGDGGERGSDF